MAGKFFNYYQFTIAAGGTEARNIIGDYIYLLNAPANKSFVFSFDDGSAKVPLKKGDKIRLPKQFGKDYAYTNFTVLNEDGSAQQIEIIAGAGDFDESDINNEITIAPATGLDVVADQSVPNITATQIAAANSSRRSIMIQCTDAECRIGSDNTVAAAKGILVPTGQMLTLNTTAEIWLYHAKGSAANVIVSEIVD